MARPRTAPTCELGRQLQKYRTERGYTVEKMAELLDIARPTYNRWLQGTPPEIINLYQIARILEVKPCDVLEWVNPGSLDWANPGQINRHTRHPIAAGRSHLVAA